MKKTLFFFLFAVTLNYSFSQKLIAVQNGNTPNFYEDLSDAIENSVAGDTLYIPGGNYVVSDTINKPIHLIGVGTHPNYTQATDITTISSSSIFIPQLVYDENADGGSIVGIHFTINFFNGDQANNISTLPNNDVSNFLIDRCYFGSKINGQFSSSLIKESIFYRGISINASNTTQVSNNIVVFRSNGFNNCTIENNIFLVAAQFFEAMNATNCQIKNNILPPNYAFDNIENCSIRNNLNSGNGISGTNIRSGNFNDNADLTTIFMSYSGTGDVNNYTADFHLPDSSNYKNGGTDGNDIGIYGGRFPWKDGSVPFNPHIVSKTISGTTNENGDLPVEIEVEAQQN